MKLMQHNYYLIAIVLFIACRWICTALMKYIEPALMMAVFAVGGILASLGNNISTYKCNQVW